MGRIRVFVADNHETMRGDIVGTATDGREAVEVVTKMNPDVLVLDITMHDIT